MTNSNDAEKTEPTAGPAKGDFVVPPEIVERDERADNKCLSYVIDPFRM